MKDLVIFERQTKLIIAIITDYKGTYDDIIMHQSIDTYLVDSNKNYIWTDDETGLIKFVNPDSKVLKLDDYRNKTSEI